MSDHESQPQESDDNRPERQPEAEPPRVWIGSLSDYNNGVLHGEWMDPVVSGEELYEQVRAMLERSEQPAAEEWGIFDYEGFGVFRVGEYEDLDRVAAIARGIAEHGLAFAAYAALHDADPGMLESFADAYLGGYDSREAWAQTIVDDFGVEETLGNGLPDWLAAHISINLHGIAHDLELSGDVCIEDNPDGGVWAFDARL